jgi:hypothetical protein
MNLAQDRVQWRTFAITSRRRDKLFRKQGPNASKDTGSVFHGP